WYQRAAEAGNVKAMHNLAVLSAGRAGEAPDYQTASRWFERAAALGLADSQYNLAVLFENGLGVAQDKKRAYQWYALAARSGDKESLRKRDALRSELSVSEAAEIDRTITDWRAETSDRLANDPRAAGEDWKKRQGADANG
ncbi:MAG: tetratricopeptide repeat protein, partial [Pseudomonadota bacterium]